MLTIQYKADAECFYEYLIKRMEHFGLSLEEEKSRLLEFGRFAESNAEKRGTKVGTFNFLGFTHYCSHGRNGKFRVKRKTSRKKFSKKCKEMNKSIRDMRNRPLKEVMVKLNQVLTGYFHYYRITDNSRSIGNFRNQIMRSLFYWLNRRSQKRSYTWDAFNEMLKVYPLAPVKIYVSVYA